MPTDRRDKGVDDAGKTFLWHKNVCMRDKNVSHSLSYTIRAWHGWVFLSDFTFYYKYDTYFISGINFEQLVEAKIHEGGCK